MTKVETETEINAPLEIERKWLVNKFPAPFRSFPHKKIRQGYLLISPDGGEARIREKDDKYTFTLKKGTGKVRQELEIEISKEDFDVIWTSTIGKRVEKTRFTIPNSGSMIEVDIYHGNLEGLMTAEVEFESEDTSNAFSVPDWFEQEVTEDERFKNQSLSVDGIPQS